jgi:hypothetical protein
MCAGLFGASAEKFRSEELTDLAKLVAREQKRERQRRVAR